LNSLIGKNDLEFALINEKKRKKKASKYVNSGRLIFMSVTTHRNFSFIEYITGGTQLDFTVAIDMTASNGNVTDPNSLHFIGGSQPNEYYIAIRSVADICQFYNNSNTFDAMGFGAKIPPQNFVNHCFPLRHPRRFQASSYRRDGSRYQILLIITDGCILDYDETLSAIIAASYLPMSIIIIGVGGENFDNMVKLDCDDGILSFQGRKAQRDIVQVRYFSSKQRKFTHSFLLLHRTNVITHRFITTQLVTKLTDIKLNSLTVFQFVPLRQFLSNRGLPSMQSISGMHASAQLAKEVLAEIPDQLTKYMKLNDIQPRPASDPFPVSVPTPYHNPAVPTANIGVTGVQTSFGWAIPKPSEQIGMGGGGYSPSQFPSTAPYPTATSLPQYPAHVPSASTAPPYPTKPLNIEFMKSSFDSGSMQPEPPPYQDTSRIPFGQTYVNVHPPNRPQPSAPPPP
uniref:Copine domain-containing protein n=1 Tax=Anisakis simplex TaxID=6269 RepID=A0A0M3K0L0_ANISI